jgi:IS30 family transposase
VESGHRLIRRVIPKGSSLNSLSQDDVDLMICHINSYKRKSLGGKSPIEMFAKMHGEEIIKALGLRLVNANEITLKPSLLK